MTKPPPLPLFLNHLGFVAEDPRQECAFAADYIPPLHTLADVSAEIAWVLSCLEPEHDTP